MSVVFFQARFVERDTLFHAFEVVSDTDFDALFTEPVKSGIFH
jgi:hypothetical protein